MKCKWTVRGDGCRSPTRQSASINSNAKRLYCLSAHQRIRRQQSDTTARRPAAAAISKHLQPESGLAHILGLTCVSFRLSVYRLRVHGPVLTRCSGFSPPVPGTGRQHWAADWAAAAAHRLGAATQTSHWSNSRSVKPTRTAHWLLAFFQHIQTDSWLVLLALTAGCSQTRDWSLVSAAETGRDLIGWCYCCCLCLDGEPCWLQGAQETKCWFAFTKKLIVRRFLRASFNVYSEPFSLNWVWD